MPCLISQRVQLGAATRHLFSLGTRTNLNSERSNLTVDACRPESPLLLSPSTGCMRHEGLRHPPSADAHRAVWHWQLYVPKLSNITPYDTICYKMILSNIHQIHQCHSTYSMSISIQNLLQIHHHVVVTIRS